MTTALTKFIPLSDLVKQARYWDRLKEVMRDRAPQFASSILQAGADLGKDCEPNSIICGAMKAAAIDLPIDKNLGMAWLVPYKVGGVKYAQLQIGYKGYVQLALRTGQYSRLNVCEIYEGELENFNRLTGDLIFSPDKKVSDKIIGYASYLRLITGFEHAEFWDVKTVEDHARRYSQAFRADRDTPWKTHFDEMGMKTVLSSHIRHWGPMSIQVATAHRHDQAIMHDLDGPPQFFDNQPEATLPKKKPALGKPIDVAQVEEPAITNDNNSTPPEPPPTEPGPEPGPEISVQDQLAKKLEAVPFDAFSLWASKYNHITPDEHAEAEGYDQLTNESCAKLLANAKALRNVISLHGPRPTAA